MENQTNQLFPSVDGGTPETELLDLRTLIKEYILQYLDSKGIIPRIFEVEQYLVETSDEYKKLKLREKQDISIDLQAILITLHREVMDELHEETRDDRFEIVHRGNEFDF